MKTLKNLPLCLFTCFSLLLLGITDLSATTAQTLTTDHLWVDAVHGSDQNSGKSPATAVRTIQRADELAQPGDTVHILPGIYRETVKLTKNGSPDHPTHYVVERGPGSAIVRGSEPSGSLRWTQLSANTIGLRPDINPSQIYYADLSAWQLDAPPRFLVELGNENQIVARLPMAREPDWHVANEYKHHEFWWAAQGGSGVTDCDPTVNDNCDRPWRAQDQLTDRANDTDPAGIQTGNLATLGNLTGGTLVAMGSLGGHQVCQGTIIAHDVSAGRVTIDKSCQRPLGWGSKYYVENKPYLLDTPGEWWYESKTGRLYLWPPTSGNPATMNVEISRRENGLVLSNRSYTVVEGLTVELFNGNAVHLSNNQIQRSVQNTVRNATLRYAYRGLLLAHGLSEESTAQNVTKGFTLESSEIAYMDGEGIHVSSWWPNGAAANSFTHSPVQDTIIRNNEIHHIGFRSEAKAPIGIAFFLVDRLRFQNNHLHHVAHHGIQFFGSVIQSPKEYGFTPDEIKTGEILIQGNLIEKTCLLAAECSGLNLWGTAPDNHVYRDTLIVGNTIRDILGWSYVSEKRGMWAGGSGSDIQGMGGFGLDLDSASGVHIYRNLIYNTAYGGIRFAGDWFDGDMLIYNNVLANALHGFRIDGSGYYTHPSVNTQVVNNILVNHEGFAIFMTVADEIDPGTTLDHNLYFQNGWRPEGEGGLYKAGILTIQPRLRNNSYHPTLADVREATPWETQGREGNPRFLFYATHDHDPWDGSWASFLLTKDSTQAIDRGASLPSSLTSLLSEFGVNDPYRGGAYDIGRYEWQVLKYVHLPFVMHQTSR